jgi:hypothetical protein
MASNTYGRVSNTISGQGGTTGYGGGYGVHGHGSHATHNTHGHGTAAHGSHSNQNDNNFSNNIAPEDYLEKQNVNGLLRDAVSLLLENRPANPILFMADHFRNLQ